LVDTLSQAPDAARLKSACWGAARRASACADAPVGRGRPLATVGAQRAAPCRHQVKRLKSHLRGLQPGVHRRGRLRPRRRAARGRAPLCPCRRDFQSPAPETTREGNYALTVGARYTWPVHLPGPAADGRPSPTFILGCPWKGVGLRRHPARSAQAGRFQSAE